ncbi:MAG: ribbon-helix-helix domain-containing protein [Cellulomonas sp.]|nr:ribbon-helix-helix domain-containing protein [Cellulomonas sp.]
MNETTNPSTRPPVDEELYEQVADAFSAETFTLPGDSVVVRGEGAEPGRPVLAAYLTPDELDAASRRGRGRPRLSAAGTGRSPKRQVRLPDDLDAALVRLAQAQGRTPSAIVREAVETYLRSA